MKKCNIKAGNTLSEITMTARRHQCMNCQANIFVFFFFFFYLFEKALCPHICSDLSWFLGLTERKNDCWLCAVGFGTISSDSFT